MSADGDAALPRLLYLGDVTVEASYLGAALLHRLLQTYPKDRLTIVEAGVHASEPQRRLAGVDYRARLLPLPRLLTTRFAGGYQALCQRGAAARASLFAGVARAAEPEAVLTVTHGASWLTAAALARRLGVPLHLICHDEWALIDGGAPIAWKEGVFGEVYRAAASRLCVSPFMAEDYARRYGASGDVLYPSRAAGRLRHDAPPARLAAADGPPTFAYAGSINSPAYAGAIADLAAALAAHGGRLLIYGPMTAEQARAAGLGAANIEIMGLIPSDRLIEELRAKADAVFVPMSFDASDRANMELSFPSKLTDYTSAGLPLLIQGPDYCSAVRWALATPGVAAVVTDPGAGALQPAVARLAIDASNRQALGLAALQAGERFFSHATAFGVLRAALAPADATSREALHAT